jgi:hypothetical protein
MTALSRAPWIAFTDFAPTVGGRARAQPSQRPRRDRPQAQIQPARASAAGSARRLAETYADVFGTVDAARSTGAMGGFAVPESHQLPTLQALFARN